MTLLEKLEAAAEGSRELDVAIYRETHPHVAAKLRAAAQIEHDRMHAPHYTTSGDDADTLVDWKDVSLYEIRRLPCGSWCLALHYYKPGAVVTAYGPTKALTTCRAFAALRARP